MLIFNCFYKKIIACRTIILIAALCIAAPINSAYSSALLQKRGQRENRNNNENRQRAISNENARQLKQAIRDENAQRNANRKFDRQQEMMRERMKENMKNRLDYRHLNTTQESQNQKRVSSDKNNDEIEIQNLLKNQDARERFDKVSNTLSIEERKALRKQIREARTNIYKNKER